MQSTFSINLLFAAGKAIRLWIINSLVFGLGWLLVSLFIENGIYFWTFLIATPGAAIGSLPVLLVLLIAIPRIEKLRINRQNKMTRLLVLCFFCTVPYGIIGSLMFNYLSGDTDWLQRFILYALGIIAALSTCAVIALLVSSKKWWLLPSSETQNHSINQHTMEKTPHPGTTEEQNNSAPHVNRTLKGAITGALILLMMIPTVFINNLVREREQRQEEIVKEVSSKWASAQTLTGPYLFIPYKTYSKDKDGKLIETSKHLWLLPDNLHVSGSISHEVRLRSIYKVLLYRAGLQNKGNFVLQLPADIDSNAVQWTETRICFGLSDFKGIEERLTTDLNGTEYELSPGLPENDINDKGLSAPVHLTAANLGKNVSFSMNLKLKGSEQLHFVPLSGNSDFTLSSVWSSPSFDGNNLPTERQVSDSGFSAKWTFNKANLPFGTVLRDFKFDQNSMAFGVTMLQPADQYAKTSRCIKYAILFIGLTFSLFFIVELMQKKPVHPVQYVLIGLALVIFYTLLLSISEFILFDPAYLIAASATILLITLYARGHFRNWKPAGLFAAVLSALYGFIFVLIRLEDTALLVGSIGLFMVLALVMYASRNIDWYGTAEARAAS
jgi:inner membrane protein